MNRDQATEIQKHLMEANEAVNRASGVAANLDTQDRKIFAALLRGFYSECDEILESIYFRYPDLRPRRPSQEQPEIDSPLRWADVVLPQSVTAADLDKIIFSMLHPRLMKRRGSSATCSEDWKDCLGRLRRKSLALASRNYPTKAASTVRATFATGATAKSG